MNFTFKVGNITKDLVLRETDKGIKVLNFDIAVNDRKSKDNEADFFKCVAWGNVAVFLNEYANKGDKVTIQGRTKNRSYTNDEGITFRYDETVVESVELMSIDKSTVQDIDEDISEAEAEYFRSKLEKEIQNL